LAGITDGMVSYLDAQMPSGMPLWLTWGTSNRLVPVVILTMTRNGNAITLAKRFYDQGVHVGRL